MKKSRLRATYRYNRDTLLYDRIEEPVFVRHFKRIAFCLSIAALVCLEFWLYTSVLGFDLPKTASLRRTNAEWQSRMAVLDGRVDACEAVLSGIEKRDDDVYRSIYGLALIPEDVKQAGFGGVNRYAYLDELGGSSSLKDAVRRLDVDTKRAYLQTTALDEVARVAREAGDMMSCIPAVPPINTRKSTYRISSKYGRRVDPVYHRAAFHDGIDFATKLGNPVYATGDGVVERVRFQFFGYGNEVIVNHGYGYKTRYAHLNSVDVVVGQKLRRGDRLGEVGNTGKSTGPHLHYEVIYMKKPVNPSNFMDLTMTPDEYSAMVGGR